MAASERICQDNLFLEICIDYFNDDFRDLFSYFENCRQQYSMDNYAAYKEIYR